MTHEQVAHYEREFPCGSCNYEANSRSSFNNLMEVMHESICYECKHCNYCDYEATKAMNYLKEASEEQAEVILFKKAKKAFQCNVCARKMVSKSGLKVTY